MKADIDYTAQLRHIAAGIQVCCSVDQRKVDILNGAADEIDLLRRELKITREALAYAISEADGWYDDSRGGRIDTPEMDAARGLLGEL